MMAKVCLKPIYKNVGFFSGQEASSQPMVFFVTDRNLNMRGAEVVVIDQ